MREKSGLEPRLNSQPDLPMREFRPERVLAPPLRPEAREFLAAVVSDLQTGQAVALDLEIGCGVGWHPIQYASQNPKRRLIAIERTAEKFEKFAARVAKHAGAGENHAPRVSLESLLPVHADAVAWTASHVRDDSISKVFILYPNPSPNNPAGRWIRMPFFGNLLTKLKRDGEILLRTNIEAYASEVKEFGERVWKLSVETQSFTAKEVNPGEAWTHFERKYLARGETCFQIRMRKRAD